MGIIIKPSIWEILLSIGTMLMAIAILATAIIAWKTLFRNREEQRRDLGLKLKNIWINDKYYRDFKYLKNNSDKYFSENKEKNFSEKDLGDLRIHLTRLFDYLGQIDFYLDKSKLDFGALKINFSKTLSIHDPGAALDLYKMLKKYEEIYEEILNQNVMMLSQIDGLFYKIAKYQGNQKLLELVNKNNE